MEMCIKHFVIFWAALFRLFACQRGENKEEKLSEQESLWKCYPTWLAVRRWGRGCASSLSEVLLRWLKEGWRRWNHATQRVVPDQTTPGVIPVASLCIFHIPIVCVCVVLLACCFWDKRLNCVALTGWELHNTDQASFKFRSLLASVPQVLDQRCAALCLAYGFFFSFKLILERSV